MHSRPCILAREHSEQGTADSDLLYLAVAARTTTEADGPHRQPYRVSVLGARSTAIVAGRIARRALRADHVVDDGQDAAGDCS